jgi:glycosyltransferase involved in cell wall biosynthesis
MKIVIDARMLFWTGIGRYTLALLRELEQIDKDNVYVVLVRREDWDLWEPACPQFSKVESSINPYTFSEQWTLWLQLRALKADVVHFTAPNTPLLYRGRRAVTIHDLTLLDYNTSRGTGIRKVLRGLKRLPFWLVLRNDVRFATVLLTVTDYVHDQLIERLGASSKRVHTTLLSTDQNLAEPESLDRFGPLGRFIFYVGNMYPYKNVESTLRALSLLSAEHDNITLVIAGKRDSFSQDLERIAGTLGMSQRVRFVGFVSDGEMVALYRAAALYVNPSLSEGFGLQGLEAMAQGTAVVAARASCLPEVYGDAAEYFDPHDAHDQARAIERVLNDKHLADKLQAAGRERLKHFSWRQMAEHTLAAYMDAASKPPKSK